MINRELPKMSPQARYNREIRQCPMIREIEAEKQQARRSMPEAKAKARAYWRANRHRYIRPSGRMLGRTSYQRPALPSDDSLA